MLNQQSDYLINKEKDMGRAEEGMGEGKWPRLSRYNF
jgi:hypothetical protein